MSSDDPIVTILLEAAQRGRELRRQREAQKNQTGRETSHGDTPDLAGDNRAERKAQHDRQAKDTTP
jgi:hypothetical protein